MIQIYLFVLIKRYQTSFEFDIYDYYSKVSKTFHNGGFMISNEISMNYLDSFIEEDNMNLQKFGDWHKELSPKLHIKSRLFNRYI